MLTDSFKTILLEFKGELNPFWDIGLSCLYRFQLCGMGFITVTKSIFTSKYDRFRVMLVEARKTAGFTQVELAQYLGRPQSYVSKYERGERRLDVVEFLDVAVALDLDVCDFLNRLNDYPNSNTAENGVK
jgi:DNA-binding XRE family transcriptional regulator